MGQIAVVALTVAGLVVCPGVCWVHALGGCGAAPLGLTAAESAAPCGCACCEGPRQPAPETPAPGKPRQAPAGNCICKGATVASKSDAPVQPAAGDLLFWLSGPEEPLRAPAVADRGPELFHPLAHAPPTGRALRVLLQSFLA